MPYCLSVLFLAAILFLPAILVSTIRAQGPAETSEPLRIGPGVQGPQVKEKVSPKYSEEARANRVQGTVMIQMVVNEQGHSTDLQVIGPLGFGLDEEALAAVARWKFKPGSKDGVPRPVLVTVQVNFSLQGMQFDWKAERVRSQYNSAFLRISQKGTPPDVLEKEVQTMRQLSRDGFGPAIYREGVWLINGEHGPQDAAAGLRLIQQAAAKRYSAALFDVALRKMDGRGLDQDTAAGMKMMHEAAAVGNRQAQYYLGGVYEKGERMPSQLDQAKRYYRLCASQGAEACRYRLGRILFDAPQRRERDLLEAIAFLQLAAEQRFREAERFMETEAPKLTPSQSQWVEQLKQQLKGR
ncbi:MAG: TonB family protein [Acidobacteriota bacterium]|jgi:TonB family protein|nr:TonB family protein [Bryobacteraceae bacterium CoA2 C42]MCA2962877.1 TonB family protein [Acidobacteriaceae bacterium]